MRRWSLRIGWALAVFTAGVVVGWLAYDASLD